MVVVQILRNSHLAYFSLFEVVIQANCWVLEIIHQWYSIELLHTHQFQEVRSTSLPCTGPNILTEDVEDLLRKWAVTPVPLDQERSVFYIIYFLVPK